MNVCLKVRPHRKPRRALKNVVPWKINFSQISFRGAMINSKVYLFLTRGAAWHGAAFDGAASTDFYDAAQRGAARRGV